MTSVNGEIVELATMRNAATCFSVVRNNDGIREEVAVMPPHEKVKVLARLLPIIKSEWRGFFKDFKTHYPEMYNNSKATDKKNYEDLKWAIMRIKGIKQKDYTTFAFTKTQSIVLSINDRLEELVLLDFQTKSKLYDVVTQCRRAVFGC